MPSAVGLLGEGDLVLLAVGEAAHHDARQAVLPLQPHEKILIGDDVEDEPARTVRLDLAPVLRRRIVGGRLDDAVILRAAGIGEDDQAPVMMIHRVVVLGLARRDEARRRGLDRVASIRLTSAVSWSCTPNRRKRSSWVAADLEEIAGIVLLVDEGVGSSRADGVAEQTAGAMLLVEPDIEQRLAVGGPLQGAVIVGDLGYRRACRCPSR